MYRVCIFMEMDKLPPDIAELEASLKARLEEFYVDVPGEDGKPFAGRVLGIDVDED